MPYPERIETDRLTLRRLTEDDADAYAAIWADPTVWAALRAGDDADPPEAAAKSLEKQLRHWEKHGFGLWSVMPQGEEATVGWIGAWYPDFVPEMLGEIEIGWTLRTPFRGHGLATEGARHAIAAAFEHHEPERVISMIAPGNHASVAVAGRLGMRQASEAETDQGVILRIFELRREPG